jgi:hypothetical protein
MRIGLLAAGGLLALSLAGCLRFDFLRGSRQPEVEETRSDSPAVGDSRAEGEGPAGVSFWHQTELTVMKMRDRLADFQQDALARVDVITASPVVQCALFPVAIAAVVVGALHGCGSLTPCPCVPANP